VIDGVIQHFGKTIMPNIGDIRRLLSKRWLYIQSPNDILGQRLVQNVSLRPLGERCQAIFTASGCAMSNEGTFFHQPLEVFVDRLPRDTEMVGRESRNVLGVPFHAGGDELADLLASGPYFSHDASDLFCQLMVDILSTFFEYCQPCSEPVPMQGPDLLHAAAAAWTPLAQHCWTL
jgi:hypothetical protein